MRKPYLERLKEGVLLFDGAMGTMLYEKGIFLNQCFENTNLTAPDKVLEIHREMARAGAQALTTNSFGAHPIRLSGYSLKEKCYDINYRSVELAREVAGEELYVAGSVGPLGKILAPLGELSQEEAEEAFTEQIRALLDGGVDILLFETFKNLDELLLALRAGRTLSRDIPIQAQYSFRPHRTEQSPKETVIDIFGTLEQEEAVDILGLNCSTGPAYMLDALSTIAQTVSKPVSIMPNAGFPRDYEERQIYLASPEYFAEYAIHFVEAGASILGGCCGTTPAHIKKMAQGVLNFAAVKPATKLIDRRKREIEAVEPTPLSRRSSLGKALSRGEWVQVVELVPPLGTSLEKVLEKSGRLAEAGIHAINIPDGPRASSRISALVTAMEIERHTGVETIAHICCRDKNIIGMQSELLGAQAAGLRNLLLLTGDPPKTGDYPEAAGVFDIDSLGLLSLAYNLNRGVDLAGKKINPPSELVLGAGANPTAPNLQKEVDRVFKKAEAGAEFFITQPIFDIELLVSFLQKIKRTGKPVIAGIWPLASYRNALFLDNEVPGVSIPMEIQERMKRHSDKEEARAEGTLIAREIINQVREYIDGVQVSPPFGRLATALQVLEPEDSQ
ncbi:MAG: bifunctional homocysteine S-methyltransferase/methylenetetrahydrofolate reductase [Spirochaetaceae bacterium]